MNCVLVTDSVDPYRNLALEELLFESQGKGVTLYLWQNERTVVIGRNQNAWRECRVELLENEGGRLARRSSGGGAVFHDLGNLNFTFLLPREDYDLARQLSVVRRAAAMFGVETEFTGRNDLVVTASQAKFSGNAFRFSGETALHHGTILVNADFTRLARYLAPSERKLESKGVKSVASRVVNLCELAPALTIGRMKQALLEAFSEIYGPAQTRVEQELGPEALARVRERYASWMWRFGETPAFNVSFEHRFDWGCIELLLDVQGGFVSSVSCYTDAMDATLAGRLELALCGAAYQKDALHARLLALDESPASELAGWLMEQPF